MAPAPVIRLHPDDGVLIARSSLSPGVVVADGVATIERIPAGHKVAIKPIAIGDLWALTPGNGGAAGDPNALYFTAGVQDEAHGLFGSLTPNSPPSMMMADGSHHMSG